MIKTIYGYKEAAKVLNRAIYAEDTAVYQKSAGKNISIEQAVKRIITNIRKNGDKALRLYSRKFDNLSIDKFEVGKAEIEKAFRNTDKELINALELAAARIRAFHNNCRKETGKGFFKDGVGRKVRPLEIIGIYVPGGTAIYPSTVLMTAIPASVAGVRNIIMVTPPDKKGEIPQTTLAAAKIAGVSRIFKVGGAQAIAALAYGTESIPKVDKICGPGNIYVATAKKLVFGVVDIDGIQGPSEVLILADEYANPVFCAADMIAQSEHDSMASSILITTSSKLSERIQKEIGSQLNNLDRKKIADSSLKTRGTIVIVDTFKEAIKLANMYAPEHLLIMSKNAENDSNQIENAGCICINEPVALGDYIAGPSHVLPTGGTARFTSPLSIEDFLKYTSIINIGKDEIEEIGKAAVTIATKEGLTGHARTIELRIKNNR
jgi:histidinol dehydrogenase